MSLNFDVPAAAKACSRDQFEQVSTEYDVFVRSDVQGEVILDTGGWDPSEEPLKGLSKILGEPADELANVYLILYME